MPSLIHELDNDSLLLLHLTGELPAEDAAEVEQLLASDAGLRAALASVGRDLAAGEAALAAADAVDPPAASPSAEQVALRRVGRAVRQWQVNRAVRHRPAAVVEAAGQRRFSWWVYAAGSVAAMVVGTVAWWGVQADRPAGPLVTTGPVRPTVVMVPATGPVTVAGRANADVPPAVAEYASGTPILADPLAALTDGPTALADAERQANTLALADGTLDGSGDGPAN